MPKTIRELADELNVSKQTIQYHYQKLPAKNQKKNGQGVNLIGPTAERIIRDKVAKPLAAKSRQRTNKDTQKGSKDNNLIITDLKREIDEIKKDRDKQLTTKDQQIENLTKLLDQSQQLQLVAEKKIEKLSYLTTSEKKWWHFW